MSSDLFDELPKGDGGDYDASAIEVLEGLSGGEQVVLRPPAELRNGLLVKVTE